jgi:hypothetical protein
MERRAPVPRTRTELVTLRPAAGPSADLFVSVAVVVAVVLPASVVDVVVPPGPVVVVVVVVIGRVSVVGSVIVGSVVVTQPMSGKQSPGAAGTELENVPAASSPAANTATPARPRPREPELLQLWRRDRKRFMRRVVDRLVDHGQQKRETCNEVPSIQ